jgi:hypothetical protein
MPVCCGNPVPLRLATSAAARRPLPPRSTGASSFSGPPRRMERSKCCSATLRQSEVAQINQANFLQQRRDCCRRGPAGKTSTAPARDAQRGLVLAFLAMALSSSMRFRAVDDDLEALRCSADRSARARGWRAPPTRRGQAGSTRSGANFASRVRWERQARLGSA